MWYSWQLDDGHKSQEMLWCYKYYYKYYKF